MKKDKYCFDKSVLIMVIVFLFLGIAAFALSQLPRSQITTNTRAEAPYILGGVVNTNGCYEYNNSSRCTQDCKKSHGNQYQCSGTTSLFCCLIKPTPTTTPNPILSPLILTTISPITTNDFAQKIVNFNLSSEQLELLNNAGFTPINFISSEVSNQMITEASNDFMLYDKNNEGGISLTGFKGTISFKTNITMLGLLSVTPSDHYAYLVQVLYENGKDNEYLIEFYDPPAMKFLSKFKTSSYYKTNIASHIKQTVDDKLIYFPITTQFLSCQNNNINLPRITESCLVFGYKEIPSGYEFEYTYLDLK